MEAEFISIHPKNPEGRKIQHVVDALQNGKLIIYPTDTVYGIGCDLFNRRALERICDLKGLSARKMNLSFICSSVSHISKFVKRIETSEFKVLKNHLPGPFTFIFESSREVPKIFGVNKKTVGIRIPNHKVPLHLVSLLGNPIVSTSVKQNENDSVYPTEASEIFNLYKNKVDLIIDSGICGNTFSTVVDFTMGSPQVVRQGLGQLGTANDI